MRMRIFPINKKTQKKKKKVLQNSNMRCPRSILVRFTLIFHAQIGFREACTSGRSERTWHGVEKGGTAGVDALRKRMFGQFLRQ